MKTINELSRELRTHTLSDFWGLIPQLILAARTAGFERGVEDTISNLALVRDAEAFARGVAEGIAQERKSHAGSIKSPVLAPTKEWAG